MFTLWSRRFAGLVFAIVMTLTFCAQALGESALVYVVKDGATVYDAEGRQMGTLPADTQLTLTGVKGKICRVEREGKTAYMLKEDLAQSPAVSATAAATPAPAATPAAQGVTAYVNKDGAGVYDVSGKLEGTLSANAQVTVTAAKGGVCQVSSGGKTGYMRKADLSASPVNAATPAATAAPTATPAPAQAKGLTAYAAADGVKVYSASGAVLATLDVNDAVTVTAVKKGVCQVTSGGQTGYVRKDDLSSAKAEVLAAPSPTPAPTKAPTGGSTVTPATGTAKRMDWWTSEIQTIFARGVVAQITDVETGLSWREKRFGGTNHADCQPLTAADTATMLKAYGGKWSWNRRAVFVTINGVNYAASINGMPHGGGSISDNNFNGHHCIHFTNSRTHGSNKVCPLHQAAIEKAASVTLK